MSIGKLEETPRILPAKEEITDLPKVSLHWHPEEIDIGNRPDVMRGIAGLLKQYLSELGPAGMFIFVVPGEQIEYVVRYETVGGLCETYVDRREAFDRAMEPLGLVTQRVTDG